MHRDELARYLDGLLDIARFRDYCPNGMQVEGRAEVHRVVTGVTASEALIDRAIGHGADALLVHHGYFWRGEDPRIVGFRRNRIAKLLGAGITLFAYHLPLDAHPEVGNNAQLAARLGLVRDGVAGEQDLVSIGHLGAPTTLERFASHVERMLGRAPLVVGDGARNVERVAWCTGGAQGYFETAAALGVDLYLTGEISEQHVHLARETGVAFIAAGHHATERFGVQALGQRLQAEHGLEATFIDVDNPV